MELSFIVIDDTEFDHFIAKRMIANKSTSFHIENFLDARLAIKYIESQQLDEKAGMVLIFLDIYMPIMDGYQFVEAFEKLPANVQRNYYIVALTSSISATDFNKINAYKALRTIITKPITADAIDTVIEQISVSLRK